MKLLIPPVASLVGLIILVARGADQSGSMRSQVTVENWDKGGALSRWVYTHIAEAFPTATIRRGGSVLPLRSEPDARVGALNVAGKDQPPQTLDQFMDNGEMDGCIVLHGARLFTRSIRPFNLTSVT